MQRIQWFKGEPSAPGDQKDVEAAYIVTSAVTPQHKTVDIEAHWIPDLKALSVYRYVYGGVESQTRHNPTTARAGKVRFHGGPFTNVDPAKP